MLKTVFLDLDNTLLDFDGGEAQALRQALTEMGIAPAEQTVRRYHEINASYWRMLEEGKVTRQQVLVGRFDRLFAELGIDCTGEEIWKRYEGHLGEQHALLPGAWELLEELSPRYDLYLASNGAASVQYPRLRDSEISGFFKGLFLSEEVGADKPDAAYFDACFATIPDFSRETAIIVGDSLTSDIRGGKNAGIRTCWFNPQGKPAPADLTPDHEVSSLEELPALLASL